MTCRNAERQALSARDGRLDEAGRAALAAHLAQCEPCRRMSENYAIAIEAWRQSEGRTTAPDPDREWQSIRCRMRVEEADNPARGLHAWLPRLPWLAVPLAAAAAAAFFLQPSQPHPSIARAPENLAQGESAVEPTPASTVVYVDENSGWLVVWATEPPRDQI
jgi:anti-sigma factor RsiW